MAEPHLEVDVDTVIERFIEDIQDCVEAVNKALPYYGKTLNSLNVNSLHGKIDVEIEDDRTIIH